MSKSQSVRVVGVVWNSPALLRCALGSERTDPRYCRPCRLSSRRVRSRVDVRSGRKHQAGLTSNRLASFPRNGSRQPRRVTGGFHGMGVLFGRCCRSAAAQSRAHRARSPGLGSRRHHPYRATLRGAFEADQDCGRSNRSGAPGTGGDVGSTRHPHPRWVQGKMKSASIRGQVRRAEHRFVFESSCNLVRQLHGIRRGGPT